MHTRMRRRVESLIQVPSSPPPFSPPRTPPFALCQAFYIGALHVVAIRGRLIWLLHISLIFTTPGIFLILLPLVAGISLCDLDVASQALDRAKPEAEKTQTKGQEKSFKQLVRS